MRFYLSLIGFFFFLNGGVVAAQVTQLLPLAQNAAGVQAGGPGLLWTQAYRLAASERIASGQAYEVVEELLVLSSQHAGEAEFDYFFGLAALKAQRYALALDALERVVLVRPEHAGAWLDLAIVYHRFGDAAAALSIVDHVQENFSPSPQQEIQLAQLRAQFTESANAFSKQHWRVELSTHLGRVSNANSGLNTLGLVLTPSGGDPVPVQIASSLKARPSLAFLARLSGVRMLTDDVGRSHEIFISGGVRQFFSEQQANQTDLNFFWTSAQPLGENWRLQAGPTLRLIDQSEQGAVSIGSFHASVTRRLGECAWGGRIEPEWRNYNRADIVSSVSPWIGAVGRCALTGGLYATGSLRFAQENPAGQRAGGQTQRTELSLQVKKALSSEFSVDAGTLIGAYRDQSGYSAIIASGDRRWIDRQALRVGLDWGLRNLGMSNTYVNAYINYISDRSNIVFSRLQDRQLYIGLRYELQ